MHSRVRLVDTSLSLVSLPRLMAETVGIPCLKIGLIDGPVMSDHPGFTDSRIYHLRPSNTLSRGMRGSAAVLHGTAIAGILVGSPTAGALGICRGATLLSCAVFAPQPSGTSATPSELADAIVQLANAGARVINMSLSLDLAMSAPSTTLEQALSYAATRGVLVVAASGNGASIDSTAITRHRAVVPVVAYDLAGRPVQNSNLGRSIGQRGLGAPGEGVISLSADGGSRPFGGSSAATAIVTGAIALLWSQFPSATYETIRDAVTRSIPRRASVVPPLLDAWRAYETLLAQTTPRS
jgi:subtilisin family serine protease